MFGAHLSRRPIQLPTAQHVQVQMVNALAAVWTVVHHNAKPLGSSLFAQLAGDRQQVTKRLDKLYVNMTLLYGVDTAHHSYSFVLGTAVLHHIDDIHFRNDQKMHRRLWRNIFECQTPVVFVDDCGRYVFGDDAIKQSTGTFCAGLSAACGCLRLARFI